MTRQTNYDPRWARRGEAYVVVADGGRARILKRDGPRASLQLKEIDGLERANARLHARDLTTDLTARHGTQSDYDPHTVEVERFARELGGRLLRLSQQDRMEELVLIAEPHFLGVLRRELPAPLSTLVTREISRNLTGAPDGAIAEAAFALPGGRP